MGYMIDNTRPKVLPDAYKRLVLRYSTLTNDSNMPVGSYSADMDPRLIMDVEDATIATSLIKDSFNHLVLLDIDMGVELIPSTTPGHYHLAINKVLPWSQYRELLIALMVAGILEEGYVHSSIERGYTAVRLPWVKKI